MNKRNSKELAEQLSNYFILIMLGNTKKSITDWTKRSKVNKSMTIGVTWNMLAHDFVEDGVYSVYHKRNLIWEFGDYLPEEAKSLIKPNGKIKLKEPFHQEPKFK